MPAVIESIVSQHAEEAAFLWLLRDAAIAAPHYSLSDLAQLDERVDAHIDGLRIAGAAGWSFCVDGLAHEEAGELFAAGVLALESGLPDRLEQVYAVGEAVPEAARGLASAFGWVPSESLRGTVLELLQSQDPFRRRLGVAACALHRVNPRNGLVAAVQHEDVWLRARALKAVGECGRVEMATALRGQLDSDDEVCRFWAAWSGTLVGDRGAARDALGALALTPSPYGRRAMSAYLRATAVKASHEWLKTLHGTGRLRDVIIGTGIVGDSSYVSWLIKQMDDPQVARVAGEAFSMLTGVDLAYDDLEGDGPEGFEAGPTEEPEDEDVSMDADEDLPWPNPALVAEWWHANSTRFVPGERFLVGQPISAQHCQQVLRTGFQRQRNAAALELALMAPDTPLFETRAPGARQQRVLGVGNFAARR